MPLTRCFLPVHCVVCRGSGASLCPDCAALLVPPPDAGALGGLDRAVALFAYDGAGRTVIRRLKFDNHRDALPPLAAMLALAVDEPIDVVTWVPTSPARRRGRGYDQAELLARAVGRAAGAPVRATVRHVGGVTQTGRARAERLTTRFEARPAARTIGANATVVVVDDVRTTGASLVGVAAALRSVGIRKVIGATLGATPRSVPFPRPDPLQSG